MAVHNVLSIFKSSVKINLDVVTYFPYVSFTEGAFLPVPQYDSQQRTALSRVIRHAFALSPEVLLSLCSYLLKPNSLTVHGRFYDRYTLVTLPRIVTPYRDSVNGTRARVTYQKLVKR